MKHSSSLTDKNLRRGMLVALMAAVVFGFYPPAFRAAYAHGANASFAVVVATWMRALAMTGYCLLKRRPLFASKEDRRSGISGGFFQAVSTGGLFGGLAFLPGPVVMIIMFSHTLLLLLYLAWRGEIKLDFATVATTVAALGGLTLVLDLWHMQAKSLIGMGLCFVAALAVVSRMYIYGREVKLRHPIVLGAENMLFAALFTSLIWLVVPPQMPHDVAGFWWQMAGSAALTVGTFCMFYGIGLLGSFRWSLFGKIEPVFTTAFSALLIHETLKPLQYLGIAAVLASLTIYQFAEHARKTRAEKAAAAEYP
jgi:drug/metabolite transporter (DMT)-like permease